MGIQNPDGSDLAENLKEEIKILREEISSKSLIIKILAENINNHENLSRIILFIMILHMEIKTLSQKVAPIT